MKIEGMGVLMKLTELKDDLRTLLSEKDYDYVIELAKEGLRTDLYQSDFYKYMGLAYQGKEQYDLAYLCFENALQYAKTHKKMNEILYKIIILKEKYNIGVRDFSIIVLTYNNLEYTQKCVESIFANNQLSNYELIIIDNNSTDGTATWLATLKDVKYEINHENKGFPAGCNQGITLANPKNDIFILNNDTIVMPNSIFNLRMALYSKENIGSSGAVSNNVSNFQMISKKFDTMDDYLQYALKNNIPDEASYEKRMKLVGFALMIKKEALNKIGLFDERFSPGNFEDDDLCLRLLQHGYVNILCKNSFIYHFGSVSFSKNKEKYNKLLELNKTKFEQKWGIQYETCFTVRSDLISMINEQPNKEFTLLEIGCSCGGDLYELKNNFPNSHLYGIEQNAEMISIAKNFADVFCIQIETEPLPFEKEFFDYLIIRDTINFISSREECIEKLLIYLKKDGVLIAN